MQHAPLDLSRVRGAVSSPTAPAEVDRRAYTLCAMERLQDSLRRRDVFVPRSERWGDPRVKLLQGAQWETMRPQVCRALGRSESPEPELHALAQQLRDRLSTHRGQLPDQCRGPGRTGERP